MTGIEFDAVFGDEIKHVELTQPDGAGDQWFIIVDKFHMGAMFKRQGQWVYYDRHLTMDDIQALADRLENRL